MPLHYVYGDLVNGGFDPGFLQSNRIWQTFRFILSGKVFLIIATIDESNKTLVISINV